ncbi:bifunctional allantoicase/OHCU decarboxylase [Sorangium cellulosum]|jgi:allantoicase|uniref:Probable allantoicase n=1 Tax=Sorangium cellulosum TaxID=56 RepID=A0A4P2Q5W7_SORCE|nr:allantoicase [Sorangium cellulosum]AUX24790.1 bifunctional allantoicase/OHCU decarboxylase [Sorangium cellulosum]
MVEARGVTAPAFAEALDLASERLGGAVLAASDEFFAPKENLLRASRPVFLEHEYTDRGKWMDGWETRRRRTPGFDWCLVRLGLPGIVRGILVDTAFFRGNYPEHCSIEACAARPDALLDPRARWVEIVPRSPLAGDAQNAFAVSCSSRFTHLRLNIYPDGGVARLRVHGDAVPDWRRLDRPGREIDLAAAENGARVLSCSDMFFGVRHNLIMPGRAANMGEGWETRRRRGPGHDWALVALAAQGEIDRIEVDTSHFKGNYPDSCMIEGIDAAGRSAEELAGVEGWREIVPQTKLQPHTRHLFEGELRATGPFTHVRLNIYPDGGVSRLRVHGKATRSGAAEQRLRLLNALTAPEAEAELRVACGASAWASQMAEARPFRDEEHLRATAEQVFARLGPEDWLEAFRAHPRIGEARPADVAAGKSALARRFSSQEQAGTSAADQETREALARDNRAYDEKFGHIFIVCATGKSAGEMLQILRERLEHTPEEELAIAAEEQRKITAIRLKKMLWGG